MAMPVMNKAIFNRLILGKEFHDPKGRVMQKVPRETPLIAESVDGETPSYEDAAVAPRASESGMGAGSVFPTETVLYKSTYRDYDVSLPYNKSLTILPPFFHLAITFQSNESSPESSSIPITLHRGRDSTGPIYGFVNSIERHTVATINTQILNPSHPFALMKVDIDAHLTKEYCDYSFSVPAPDDPSKQVLQRFQWKQCTSSPEVLDLCRSRPEGCESHDWCWVDRKNERGMKLFYVPPPLPGYSSAEAKSEKKSFFGRMKEGKVKVENGTCLAVYVAAKSHSRMNPMKIAARVRWFEDAWSEGGVDGNGWGEEGRVAAFLALIAYGEKTRRVGTGAGY